MERKRNDYIAVAQSTVAHMIGAYLGAEIGLPNYIEYMYPDKVKKDTRTSKEIIGDLIDKLRK